jgi:hypothetical protein
MALPPLTTKGRNILIGVGVFLAIALAVLLGVFLGVKPGSTPSGVTNLKATRTMDGVTATFTPKNMSEAVVVYAVPWEGKCPSSPPSLAQSQVVGPGGTSTYAAIPVPLEASQTPTLTQPPVCVWAGAVASGDQQPAKFTKPVVLPAPVVATGNNGSVPCAIYCAANWGNQLPKSWTGAVAVAQQPARGQVQTDPNALIYAVGTGNSTACLCAESDTPFLTANQVPNPFWQVYNQATASCGPQGTTPDCPKANLCSQTSTC